MFCHDGTCIVCWRELAENCTESLTKGTRVMVSGRLDQRSWDTQEGEKRSKVEVVDETRDLALVRVA